MTQQQSRASYDKSWSFVRAVSTALVNSSVGSEALSVCYVFTGLFVPAAQ